MILTYIFFFHNMVGNMCICIQLCSLVIYLCFDLQVSVVVVQGQGVFTLTQDECPLYFWSISNYVYLFKRKMCSHMYMI